jgi:hypothetical protein
MAAAAIHAANRRQRGIDDAPLVGDFYALRTDRGDRQSGEKESVMESHVE